MLHTFRNPTIYQLNVGLTIKPLAQPTVNTALSGLDVGLITTMRAIFTVGWAACFSQPNNILVQCWVNDKAVSPTYAKLLLATSYTSLETAFVLIMRCNWVLMSSCLTTS